MEEGHGTGILFSSRDVGCPGLCPGDVGEDGENCVVISKHLHYYYYYIRKDIPYENSKKGIQEAGEVNMQLFKETE